MLVILAYDGLEYELVRKFNCSSLQQESFGKVDLSRFKKVVTPAIFSTLFTGHYPEETGIGYSWDEDPIPLENAHERTGFRTLFQKVEKSKVVSAPRLQFGGNSSNEGESKKSLYERWVETGDEKFYQKKKNQALRCFERHFQELLFSLSQSFNLVFMWDHLPDTIQHFWIGNHDEMRWLYTYLDDCTYQVKNELMPSDKLLIISDHGGKRYRDSKVGVHSDYGFWSLSEEKGFSHPDMAEIHRWVVNQF